MGCWASFIQEWWSFSCIVVILTIIGTYLGDFNTFKPHNPNEYIKLIDDEEIVI